MKPRFLTATALFDGNDAGINLLRKHLIKHGAEIIHLGHSRSSYEIVKTAVEEDVNGIIVSVADRSYLDIYPSLCELLKQRGLTQVKLFGYGRIPAENKAELEKQGVEQVYALDDTSQSLIGNIVEDMIARSRFSTIAHFFEKRDETVIPKRDNRDVLAKHISLLTSPYDELGENPRLPQARNQLEQLLQNCTRKVPMIGFTGGGGSGKSSLIDEVLLRFHYDFPDAYLAVVVIDPRKRKSGGALLGDRIRMNSIYNDHTFMRSLVTPHLNYFYDAVPTLGNLFKMAGYDFIFIETPGIGQVEADIIDIVDLAVYIMTSDYGSYTQLEKTNILDFADVIALNKFENKRCEDSLQQIRRHFRANRNLGKQLPEDSLPVFGTAANRFNDEGINLLYLYLLKFLEQKFGIFLPSKYDRYLDKRKGLSVNRVNNLIAYDQLNYLGEITKTVRNYHKAAVVEASKVEPLPLLEDIECHFAGEGIPQKANRRLHFLRHDENVHRLHLYFDTLTQYGCDPQLQPEIYSKIGDNGVNIATLDDMKSLFAGFDLCNPQYTICLRGGSTAAILLAMFVNTAVAQNLDRYRQENNLPGGTDISEEILATILAQTLPKLQGFLVADALDETQSGNSCSLSVEFSLKLLGDIQEYLLEKNAQQYRSLSVSGHHMARAGADPVTTLAFMMANAFTLLEYCHNRGMKLNEVAEKIFWFFCFEMDPESSALGRVARHVWSIALKDYYHTDAPSQKLQYQVCRSHVEELSGQVHVEPLTDLVEQAVLNCLDELDRRGGVLKAMESQYQRGKICGEAWHYGDESESDEAKVGQPTATAKNIAVDRIETMPANLLTYEEKQKRLDHVAEFKARHQIKSQEALTRLEKVVLSNDNVFRELLYSVRYCTIEQIMRRLFELGAQRRQTL